MVLYVEQTHIQYGYRSDHSVIVLKFLFRKKEMKQKTFWKIYNSLLKDYAYIKEINEEIKNVIEEGAIMLYHKCITYLLGSGVGSEGSRLEA